MPYTATVSWTAGVGVDVGGRQIIWCDAITTACATRVWTIFVCSAAAVWVSAAASAAMPVSTCWGRCLCAARIVASIL